MWGLDVPKGQGAKSAVSLPMCRNMDRSKAGCALRQEQPGGRMGMDWMVIQQGCEGVIEVTDKSRNLMFTKQGQRGHDLQLASMSLTVCTKPVDTT